MGSGGSSKSRQKSQPWAAQQPFLKEIYNYAQNLYGGDPYQYGPGRVAGPDAMQQQGWGMAQQRAMQGSPLLGQAQEQTAATLRGDYMDPDSNPWLSKMYDAAASPMTRNFMTSVMPTLNSQFAMGRTQGDAGGTAQTAAQGRAQGELARGLGDLSSNLYGGFMQQERGRQMSAAQMAPGLAQADYFDANVLGQVGAEKQSYAQRALDDIVSRFNFNQHEPAQRLAEYSAFIGAPVQTSEGKSKSMNMSLLWG